MQNTVCQHKTLLFENRWSAISYLFLLGNWLVNDLVTEIVCKPASVC